MSKYKLEIIKDEVGIYFMSFDDRIETNNLIINTKFMAIFFLGSLSVHGVISKEEVYKHLETLEKLKIPFGEIDFERIEVSPKKDRLRVIDRMKSIIEISEYLTRN